MNKLITALLLCCLGSSVWAAGGDLPEMMEANINLGNKTSLQRGARLFVNYCLSCHSAQYMRYARMAEDLALPEDVVKDNLMFTTDKIGDTMRVAMRPEDAEQWFGVAPPDLSVIARARGEDWLYSFLNGFHVDDKRPTGVNNLYFPDTAMPHVLADLQGLQRKVEHDDDGHDDDGHDDDGHDDDGHDDDGHGGGAAFEQVSPGQMSADEYRQATRDLTAFLVYMGEPAKLVRYRIGFWVIAFLLVLLVATYLLKREYWKDVH